MLNTDVRDKAIADLDKAISAYESVIDKVRGASESLYEKRLRASKEIIQGVEAYISGLANRPKDFDKSFAEIKGKYVDFNAYVTSLSDEAKASGIQAGGATGAGAAVGVGVAALGPTAMLAVATTFGTASTGTAISALSGAAAANAAAAWLGGGAIAAGGGGMAAGKLLLVAAGPIGWGIGAAALIGGGLWYRHKNQEIADEAMSKRIEINGFSLERQAMLVAIEKLIVNTSVQMDGVTSLLEKLQLAPKDFDQFSDVQRDQLIALKNHTESLGQLLRMVPDGVK